MTLQRCTPVTCSKTYFDISFVLRPLLSVSLLQFLPYPPVSFPFFPHFLQSSSNPPINSFSVSTASPTPPPPPCTPPSLQSDPSHNSQLQRTRKEKKKKTERKENNTFKPCNSLIPSCTNSCTFLSSLTPTFARKASRVLRPAYSRKL